MADREPLLLAADIGATKTALRQVTTKDHWDFEAFVGLGQAIANGQDAEYTSKRRL